MYPPHNTVTPGTRVAWHLHLSAPMPIRGLEALIHWHEHTLADVEIVSRVMSGGTGVFVAQKINGLRHDALLSWRAPQPMAVNQVFAIVRGTIVRVIGDPQNTYQLRYQIVPPETQQGVRVQLLDGSFDVAWPVNPSGVRCYENPKQWGFTCMTWPERIS